jgi:hypothetical protein
MMWVVIIGAIIPRQIMVREDQERRVRLRKEADQAGDRATRNG